MEELWTELLAHWMAAGWLPGWLVGWLDGCWLAQWSARGTPGSRAQARVVVLLLFLGPYSLAQWRLKAIGYKTRDCRIQDTDRDRAAGYKTAELIRLRTGNSPLCFAA